MTEAFRLPPGAPGRFGAQLDRDEPVGFRFGGRPFSGVYGDTLTSALLASGVRSWASSARLRRARGPMGLGLESQTPVSLEGDVGLWAAISADEILIREGLNARPVPLGLDGVLSLIPQTATADARSLPAPQRLFERIGRVMPLPAPRLPPITPAPDAQRESCEVLVIGAGLAGLAAATAARAAGLDVRMVEASSRAGGVADLHDAAISGRPAALWAEQQAGALRDRDALRLRAVAIDIDPDGAVTVVERPDPQRPGLTALRLISASAVIVATGFRERPLPFPDNDRPGIFLSVAARALLRRQAIAPGQRVVVATLSDDGYRTAVDLKEAGVGVTLVLDARDDPSGAAVEIAKAHGMRVSLASVVTDVAYDQRQRRLVGVRTANRHGEGVASGARALPADALVMSGGFVARDELVGALDLDEEQGVFLAFGGEGVGETVAAGWAAGVAAAERLGGAPNVEAPAVEAGRDDPDGPLAAYLERLHAGDDSAFVDLGADVAFADLAAAVRLGVTGGHALARRLGLGHGVDGGRISADLAAQALAALTGRAAAVRPPSPGRPTLGLLAARAGLRKG